MGRKARQGFERDPFLIIRDTAIIGSFHTHASSFQISFSVTAVCCPLDRESFFFFLFFLPRSRYRKIMNAQMKDAEPVAKWDASWSFARAPTYCLPAKVIKWEEKSIHRHAGVRNNGPPAVLKTLLDLCR